MELSSTLKTVIVASVLIPIGIWITLTLYNDLYSDTNTAVDDLNTTMDTEGYSEAGSFLTTAWKISQYGFVIMILSSFGLVVILKALGKI